MPQPKKIVVLGANGGIGLALTDYFLSTTDWQVEATYRSSATALQAIFKKHSRDPSEHCWPLDAGDAGAVHERFAHWDQHGELWGVVNLCGVSYSRGLLKSSPEEILLNVVDNLSPVINATYAMGAVKERLQSGGRIIHFSSVLARHPIPGTVPYVSSKLATEGFVAAAALELSRLNILINCVRLGYFATGMAVRDVPQDVLGRAASRTALRRLGSPSELFPLIDLLLSPDNAFMTGSVVTLDGCYG